MPTLEQGAPAPSREPPVEGVPGLFQLRWLQWFRDLRQQVDATPARAANPVSVTSSTDAIGVTPIPSDVLPAGLYRVTGYVRVTAAAITSSSVAVTLFWVDGGVTCSIVLIAAVTGNTTDSTGSDTKLVRIDATTPISYSTTYASNGANEMAYDLVLLLEAVAI
jgi:hypothetical protein